MPKVVPSLVVDFIDRYLPPPSLAQEPVKPENAGRVRMLLDLFERVPEELLPVSGSRYVDLLAAMNTLGADVARLQAGQKQDWRNVKSFALLGQHLEMIRSILAKCPDASAAPGTTELKFIADVVLRESLRRDISSASTLLGQHEYKAVTVLAGSVIEALLLWALQETEKATPNSLAGVVATLQAAGKSAKGGDPEWWYLWQLIAAAHELGLIKNETAIAANLGRDFRNLIHPGVAQRNGAASDRGTALTSLGALEHVVRDLAP